MFRRSLFRFCNSTSSTSSSTTTTATGAAAAAATTGPTVTIKPEKEWWEMHITNEHKSLVLLLYRSLMKEMIKLPSVRRRTFITYCRIIWRKRAKATEKLLIDECVEEARRAIYIAHKHNNMKNAQEYVFDDMFLPKDTGQDVKTFMEEVYDPAASRHQIDSVQDVQPGREMEHGGGLRGQHFRNNRVARETMKEQLNRPVIKDHEMKLRPPPPPNM